MIVASAFEGSRPRISWLGCRPRQFVGVQIILSQVSCLGFFQVLNNKGNKAASIYVRLLGIDGDLLLSSRNHVYNATDKATFLASA